MAEDRVALVTGSSGGIGRAIALRLAAAGLRVAVAARTDATYPATVEEAVEEIRGLGGQADGYECDLSVREQRLGLVARVEQTSGPIAVLVNNAAVIELPRARRLPREALHADVRRAGQGRAGAEPGRDPRHERARQGWIVQHHLAGRAAPQPPASGVGVDASRGTVYGMCKAAIERFTTGLAAELYDDGINVNALAPTHIVPTFGAAAFFDLTAHATEPPEVMADVVHHLTSRRPDRITGRILYSQEVARGLAKPDAATVQR